MKASSYCMSCETPTLKQDCQRFDNDPGLVHNLRYFYTKNILQIGEYKICLASMNSKSLASLASMIFVLCRALCPCMFTCNSYIAVLLPFWFVETEAWMPRHIACPPRHQPSVKKKSWKKMQFFLLPHLPQSSPIWIRFLWCMSFETLICIKHDWLIHIFTVPRTPKNLVMIYNPPYTHTIRCR